MNTVDNDTFPPQGLTYFWFLNDYCDSQTIDKQINAFFDAGIKTVCLHPRAGLMLPYGGDDWFAFVRCLVGKLADSGIETWLYDEDPYPSGNAGGRIIRDYPEFTAKKITMHRASNGDVEDKGLWFFPANGRLISCVLLSPDSQEIITDLTGKVGMIRRDWHLMKKWDSKWYYPATPLYISDRAMAHRPEYAIQLDGVPENAELVAFTIDNVDADGESIWGGYTDTLNPRATEKFLAYTHERYLECLGDRLGTQVTTIFTDEAKYYGFTPWTPGMFEDFRNSYGYDLVPRLVDLFDSSETARSIQTRLHYRDWCGRRFEDAWLKPVSTWCRRHNLKLVGHFSPEEDPVSQATTISNLFPLQKHLSLAGLDLIIPAVGDRDHPLLNISIVAAVSSAQQQQLPGVMSESLAASGEEFSIEKIRKIILWQTSMGMTTPVVHGIFLSMREERQYECPPDFGPWTEFGPGLTTLAQELQPIQEQLLNATQIAPVAILWPIKSFHAKNAQWQTEPGGLREELTDLVLICLENHVGVHIIDEEDFLQADMGDRLLRIGNAAYSHLIIPGSTIWTAKTWRRLAELQANGFNVFQYGTAPRFLEGDQDILPIKSIPFPELTSETISVNLPKLLDIDCDDSHNIRVTGWRKEKEIFYLCHFLGCNNAVAEINNKRLKLSSTEIYELKYQCKPVEKCAKAGVVLLNNLEN